MIISDKALSLLAVSGINGIGRVAIYKDFQHCDTPTKFVDHLARRPKAVDLSIEEFEDIRSDIRKQIERLADAVDGVVAVGEPDFPHFRWAADKRADAPFVLFYKGDISLLGRNQQNVSVIGVLNPDEDISRSERMVVKELCANGVNIVSGLALGCDSIAHQTALDCGAKTVAILPSTLDSILPAKNKALAEEIVANGGLLITEYYKPEREIHKISQRYIERDRLQALFADAVLLAASYDVNSQQAWGLPEGKYDCGSRHAMAKAFDYGIRRAVIYNDIKHGKNPMFDLNRNIALADRAVLKIDSANMQSQLAKLTMRRECANLFG